MPDHMGPLFANLRPLTDEESAGVDANRGLVYKVVLGFWRTFPDANRWETSFEDLIQVGTVGLIHAMQKFDPTTHGDCTFSTYAWPCIWGYLMRHSWYDRKAFGQWSRSSRKRTRRLVRVIPVDPTAWTGAHQHSNEGDDHTPRLSQVEQAATNIAMHAGVTDPWDSVEAHMDGARVLEVAIADPRDRRILADRADNISLEEIGVGFGVSRERIRQLEERALATAYRFVTGVAAQYADRKPKSPARVTPKGGGGRRKKETPNGAQ